MASARSCSRLRRYWANCSKSDGESETTYEFGTNVLLSEIVWCASIARMRRFAIWTGCSFAPKRRALHPSISRLANASSRSTSLYDLRADQDDDRREIDPCEEPGREGKGTVGREDREGAREEAERKLGDLPQHGRYQGRLGGHPARDTPARDRAIDKVEEDVADDEAEERREHLHGRAGERPEAGVGKGPGQCGDAVGQPEGHDRQERDGRDKCGCRGVAADEGASSLLPKGRGEGQVERTVDRRRGEDRPDGAEAE